VSDCCNNTLEACKRRLFVEAIATAAKGRDVSELWGSPVLAGQGRAGQGRGRERGAEQAVRLEEEQAPGHAPFLALRVEVWNSRGGAVERAESSSRKAATEPVSLYVPGFALRPRRSQRVPLPTLLLLLLLFCCCGDMRGAAQHVRLTVGAKFICKG